MVGKYVIFPNISNWKLGLGLPSQHLAVYHHLSCFFAYMAQTTPQVPTTEVSVPAPLPPVSRGSRILVAVLILIFVLHCLWFIRTQAFTNDEPEHLVAGLEAWRFGEFKRWHDQPPLARLLFAIPLQKTNWSYKLVDEEVNPVSPAAEVWLGRSRPMNVLLGVGLLLLLWATAWRLFSESAANFALALAVLSPDLIAHFSLATIDGIGALFIFAVAVQLARWWLQATRGRALVLGLLLGGMLLSKFNSPPLFTLALAAILIRTGDGMSWSPRNWRWGRAAAVFAIACFTVWTGYFYHISKVTFADQMVTIHFSGYTKMLQYEMPTLQRPITIFLPACEWMTGLGQVIVHNMEGHRSFFLGWYSTQGFKTYFPAAMLLKWPIVVLALALIGILFAAQRRFPARRELLLMSIFPAIYFVFAVFSHINIGVRHVLPIYPFLLLYAALAWDTLRRNKRATLVLLGLLVFQAADIARYAPDYLSYFTIAVPQDKTWQYLSDSNTDWGQGMYALRNYQREHPKENLYVAYVGEVDPEFYGIRYTKLEEGDRPSGTVVVSATHLSGELLQDHHAFRWLLAYPRKTILNHTLYVFDVRPHGK